MIFAVSIYWGQDKNIWHMHSAQLRFQCTQQVYYTVQVFPVTQLSVKWCRTTASQA